MFDVKGTLQIARVSGNEKTGTSKRETLTFGTVDHLRKIQETLDVVNTLVNGESYIVITEPRMSVKKDDDIVNWQYKADPQEMLAARDTGLNDYVIHKTVEQLERMTDPLGHMPYDEKFLLLHCLILDTLMSPDSDMNYGHIVKCQGRLAYAEKLAIELNKPEFQTTLMEMTCDYNSGGSRLAGIFERPVQLGGLKGIKEVHKQSMRFYDKSMAFKLEASMYLKSGRKIFDDIREQYAVTGKDEMKI